LQSAALVAALCPSAALAETEHPWNLVLLVAEDSSPRLGSYGDELARTPNLDRLAAEGTRYTRVFTTSGVCAPSRAAIIMGAHQNHWGAGHMRAYAGGYVAVPPPEWKAFPELLRAAGYYVVNDGKTDYQTGTGLGGAFGGPESIWDAEDSEDWRGRAEGQPFFAYLTFLGTHESQVWTSPQPSSPQPGSRSHPRWKAGSSSGRIDRPSLASCSPPGIGSMSRLIACARCAAAASNTSAI
jgi:N-sulfoglucosamine sulfohydrolase